MATVILRSVKGSNLTPTEVDTNFSNVNTEVTAATTNVATNTASIATVKGGTTVNSQSAAYTLVLGDAGATVLHPVTDTTARTFTIPSNASVAYPVGTTVSFDNESGAGVLTIAITTDTLQLVGAAGTTGSRTLASGGFAVARKITATKWRISGSAELT